MTFLILFHMSHYRHFKGFYTEYVQPFLTAEFPGLVSYNRIITLKKRAIVPLCAFLSSRKVKSQGIVFIDSTKIAVCHNVRIPRNKVFEGIAKRGKLYQDKAGAVFTNTSANFRTGTENSPFHSVNRICLLLHT
ncbi:hypothetical protein FE393_18355 [Xenorhabdus sp. psl]|nr:transposase [Xenorhabdus sp. psl]MDX7993202.1 hypothetical protein [Xenorhabdus sp. psl]